MALGCCNFNALMWFLLYFNMCIFEWKNNRGVAWEFEIELEVNIGYLFRMLFQKFLPVGPHLASHRKHRKHSRFGCTGNGPVFPKKEKDIVFSETENFCGALPRENLASRWPPHLKIFLWIFKLKHEISQGLYTGSRPYDKNSFWVPNGSEPQRPWTSRCLQSFDLHCIQYEQLL